MRSGAVPIYEYECRHCGHQFELLVLKTTVVACPECQSPDLEQLLSGFSVSTDDMTRARVKAARKAYKASGGYRDQKVAEAEEVKEHSAPPPPPPKKK
jgi:putative FmdB family regulatory protein